MNTAVNEYNYRFKLTDYSLFDRNRARKVAIYGRVSTEHEAQLSALENQLQWYDDQVKYHPNWTVCERYIDEGITGTQAKKRPAFLKMIEDAKQGKFDLIVTREVCRFARNVVDTLVVTRELKGIGVEVFFIDDNIWTMDGDGELRLSLMATLARDIWVNKLRCSCGSSYRKNKWHTKLDGKTSYGYQCYNQLNNGIKRKRAEIGLDTEGYCDSRMITDWKLDFMAKALLEHLWTERKESVLIALDLIKYYYKEEKSNETQSDTVTIQAKLDKANSRLTNLIAMRADGEISKDEYQAMRSPVDEEIKKLQKALDEIPQEKSNPKGLDIEGIRSTLNSFIDFSGSTISHDVVNQFVYLITPTSDTTFDWYVNLNGTADVKATFTAEGRKKNCIIKLEEIEKISSVHREKNEDNAHFIKNPHIFTYLHRQQSLRRTHNLSCVTGQINVLKHK